MSVVGDLARAEWRSRKRAYVALVALFAATSATYALVLALVGGLEERIGGELSDNLAADVRVSLGSQGVADGEIIPGAADVETYLRHRVPGARVAHRLEVEALFVHGAGFATGREDDDDVARSAGIVIGVDAARERGVLDTSTYMRRGVALADAPAMRLPDGTPLVPMVVGEQFLKTTNTTVATDGFTWTAVFNVSAGRLENNQLVKVTGIVVGSYETGFRMIDRAIVYMPRGEVARLVGEHPDAPPANVLLVRTTEPERAVEAAFERSLTGLTARGFRETYLGPVFDTVRFVAWTVVAILSLMTAAWFAHTLGHHVNADRRKIATLRAIGLPRAVFDRLYLGLGAALGIAGGLAGLAAAALVGLALRGATALVGRPFAPRADPLEAAALLVLSLAASLAGAYIALGRVRRSNIREALA